MELWHWAKTRMNYAPATFWYADAKATWNVGAMPEEARQKVAMAIEDVVEIKRVPGAVEGESMEVIEKTGGTTEIQSVAQFEWSGNRQLWWRDGAAGDRLELEFDVEEVGDYRMAAALTKANDYGIVTISLNGQTIQEHVDLYHPVVINEEIKLGVHRLKAGKNRLSVVITGENPAAIKRRMFGLDYVLAVRQGG
jgi:hypothetical protein